LTCPDDYDQWFWVGHLAHVMSHDGSDLCDEGLTKISCDLFCPTFEPKSYQMISIDPINPILIHAIIS
jgi:hypothetical protein